MTLVRWIGALAAVLAAPAAGQDTLTLKPSGDWTLDYAEDSCTLRRTFGGGESPAWLEIMQLAPGVTYRITVSSSGLPMSRRRAPAVRFLPDGAESSYDLAAYGDYGEGFEGVAFYAMILPTTPEDVAQLGVVPTNGAVVASEAGTTGVEVRRAFDPPIVLQTGSLEGPLEAMRACMTDLVAHWDLGSAKGKLLSRPVPRNMARWSSPIRDSFPRGLVQFDGPSRIQARVIVGSDGKPETCRVIEPVVNDDYEQRTCGIILKDGEFEPARDAEGNPVRDIDVLNIVYVMSH
jgi:hypothetical protein